MDSFVTHIAGATEDGMHGESDPEFRWLERGEGEPVVLLHGLMGIPRAVVGGNSLGGHVALELALSCPDRVSGLILTGSSGLFERGFSRGVPRRADGGVRESEAGGSRLRSRAGHAGMG